MLSQSLSPAPAAPDLSKLVRGDGAPVEWAVSGGYVDYPAAVEAMEARVAAIAAGQAAELVWLLEHPPLYTAGVSSKDADLLEPGRFPVHRTGRGGQFTYHGPGQRVAYVMLDLNRRGKDVRAFVRGLEPRRQDRRHRRQGPQMGQLPRDQPECGAGPDPFQRHRALRHQ